MPGVSTQIEVRTTEGVRRHGVSVRGLLERPVREGTDSTAGDGKGRARELPVLHLGPTGPLDRREAHDD